MDAHVHVPVTASVLIRTRYSLKRGEAGLAAFGSHAVLGAWGPRKYKYATPVGGGWWHVQFYVPHGTKMWWRWLVLNNKGDEVGRERGADRCLSVDADSLVVTAEWGRPMEVGNLWPGEQREAVRQEMDPDNHAHDQYLVYTEHVDWGPPVLHTPKKQWDMVVQLLDNTPSNYVSRYKHLPVDWPPAADRPSEGLGSDHHLRQMAEAAVKELNAERKRYRVRIDQQMAQLKMLQEKRKAQSMRSALRLMYGIAAVAEAVCFSNNQRFVNNMGPRL